MKFGNRICSARGSPLVGLGGPLAETGQARETMTQVDARFNVGYADVTIIEAMEEVASKTCRGAYLCFTGLKQQREEK
jgi:hypothetical protein